MNAFKEVLSLPVITLLVVLSVYGWAMTEDCNQIHNTGCMVAANGE